MWYIDKYLYNHCSFFINVFIYWFKTTINDFTVSLKLDQSTGFSFSLPSFIQRAVDFYMYSWSTPHSINCRSSPPSTKVLTEHEDDASTFKVYSRPIPASY